tara:strand:- start:121 stop:330 length:210 start_codon:yes stop_codon:yes gene_type:complete
MNNIILWFVMMTTSCFQYPINLQQCLTPWTWFPPYIEDLKEFKQNEPYSREADRLKDAAKTISGYESFP